MDFLLLPFAATRRRATLERSAFFDGAREASVYFVKSPYY